MYRAYMLITNVLFENDAKKERLNDAAFLVTVASIDKLLTLKVLNF